MKGAQFLVPALLKTAVAPPLICYILLRYPPVHLPLPVRLILYLISWPVLFIIRSRISLHRSTVAARQAGAQPIPRVKGKWPLNLDVLVDWGKSGSEEEVGRMMVLLSRRYGVTYNTRVLGEDQIITSDPRVVRHVLIDEFDNFVKGAKFRERAEGFLGDGIFNADGDRWKFHRNLTRPFFHPIHISPSLFTPHIASFLAELPPSNLKASESTVVFDIQDRIGRLALDMALDWLCGETPSASSSSAAGRGREWEAAKDGIGEAMKEAQRVVGKRVKIGTPWPLFELGDDPLAGPMRTIRAFFSPLIAEAILRQRSGDPEKVRLIDRLVEATDQDERLIMDQLINILLAAKDTTASHLTFCIYALALHPDVQDRVYQECMHWSPEGLVNKEQIGRCTYTRHFINETLRLFPPVPLNIRRSLRPSLLPVSPSSSSFLPTSKSMQEVGQTHDKAVQGAPLYMPSNTSIIINTVQMHRDPATWGEDALDFRPERWEGRGGAEGFAAWNLGPRMCLGQPFALTATHTFLILLMRHLSHADSHESKETVPSATAASPAQRTRRSIRLVPKANSPESQMPDSWTGEGGDGRAREGRDQVWIVADVVLAVKGGLWVDIA